MTCNQCGKPAIVKIGEHPLCVDCYLKLRQADQFQLDALTRDLNFLMDQMEMTTGLYGFLPRYQVPRPPIQATVVNQPMTFNNINVDRSVVGSINTGDVKKIDVAMDHIKQSGADDVAMGIKELTEAIIASNEVQDQTRNELIEQLSFLTSQSILPKDKRRDGLIKATFTALASTLGAISSLATIWDKVGPLLKAIFGI